MRALNTRRRGASAGAAHSPPCGGAPSQLACSCCWRASICWRCDSSCMPRVAELANVSSGTAPIPANEPFGLRDDGGDGDSCGAPSPPPALCCVRLRCCRQCCIRWRFCAAAGRTGGGRRPAEGEGGRGGAGGRGGGAGRVVARAARRAGAHLQVLVDVGDFEVGARGHRVQDRGGGGHDPAPRQLLARRLELVVRRRRPEEGVGAAHADARRDAAHRPAGRREHVGHAERVHRVRRRARAAHAAHVVVLLRPREGHRQVLRAERDAAAVAAVSVDISAFHHRHGRDERGRRRDGGKLAAGHPERSISGL
jgi:hypothetical protein